MENKDDPIIWRGPLKIQAIRQFIADIDWGDLDYLIIDAPPGTGDEPLTVASTIKDAIALVVTTPQEVALADVRKSLNFCKHVKMDVLGLVENMSGLVCPHCNKTVDLFKSGGGSRTAAEFSVPFLGAIPLDPQVTIGGDAGQPYLVSGSDSPAVKAFSEVLDSVEKATSNRASLAPIQQGTDCGCGGGGCNPNKCDC
jgi:ATP-binding protein involved in chromosome partitioning